MLQTTGSLEEAQTFCKKAGELLAKETSDAEGACYHGIGHGTLDGNDPSMWGKPKEMLDKALYLCEKASPTDLLLHRCTSGVFNSAAILSQYQKYGIVISKNNPYDFCKPFLGTKFSKTCHEEMNTVALPDGDKFPISTKLIEKINNEEDSKSAMLSLASYNAKYHLDSSYFEEFSRYCKSVRSDLTSPCVVGFVGGLVEFGFPGKEHQLAIQFCSLDAFSSDLKQDCFDRLKWLFRHLSENEFKVTFCNKMEKQNRKILCP
jgi:hypothetical protein